jgi:hypothetical protein
MGSPLVLCDPAKGMTLVLGQKLCTAFHEFEPAWRAGALDERQLPFFRERLTKRIKRVLITMKNNMFARDIVKTSPIGS